MDYIYDWTTTTDLKKRTNKKEKEIEEDENEENQNKKNEEKELESNNHEQIDRIGTRKMNRDDTHEVTRERPGEDKVESVCCKM